MYQMQDGANTIPGQTLFQVLPLEGDLNDKRIHPQSRRHRRLAIHRPRSGPTRHFHCHSVAVLMPTKWRYATDDEILCWKMSTLNGSSLN